MLCSPVQPPSLLLTTGDAVLGRLAIGCHGPKMLDMSPDRSFVEAVAFGLPTRRDAQTIEGLVVSGDEAVPLADIMATPAQLSETIDGFACNVPEEALGICSGRLDISSHRVSGMRKVLDDVFLGISDHIIRIPVLILPVLQAIEHVSYGSILGLGHRVGMLGVVRRKRSCRLIDPKGQVRSAHAGHCSWYGAVRRA